MAGWGGTAVSGLKTCPCPVANTLTLTVTDAAGNSASTSIPVVQSDLALAIISADLSQAPYGVSGTIGDTNCTIWVNGVQATNNGDGTWTVQNAHMSLDTPVVQARAIPNSDNGGNGSGGSEFSANATGSASNPSSSQATDAEKELEWPDAQYYINFYNSFLDTRYVTIVNGKVHSHYYVNWQETSGGSGIAIDEVEYNPYLPPSDDAWTWPGGRWPDLPDGIDTYLPDGSTNDIGPALSNVPIGFQSGSWGSLNYQSPDGLTSLQVDDDCQYLLLTGGAPGATGYELYAITGSVYSVTYGSPYNTYTKVPPEQVQIGGIGSLGSDGVLWAALPVHNAIVATVHAQGSGRITATVQQTGYKLVSQCYATIPTNQARTTIGVGEEVNLNFSPTLSVPYSNVVWTTTAGSLSYTNGTSNFFTAPGRAATVTVTAKVFGKPVTKTFNVIEPVGIVHAQIIGTESYPFGNAGAGMTNLLWIGPTNVSFYRVNVMEVGEDATNIWGFYSQWTPQQLHHNTADHWTLLNQANQLYDHAAFAAGGLSVWGAGGYDWDIPERWQVIGSGATNSMTGCYTTYSINSVGTAKVAKYGNWVQRTTNSIITTN